MIQISNINRYKLKPTINNTTIVKYFEGANDKYWMKKQNKKQTQQIISQAIHEVRRKLFMLMMLLDYFAQGNDIIYTNVKINEKTRCMN